MSSNEYMAAYMRKRYHKRRAEWIEKLGGQCVWCGTTENLHFDHIKASEKIYDIGKILNTHSIEKIASEMSKCQLLCEPHHIQKSQACKDVRIVDHGEGLTGKRNCRCDLCKPLKNAYARKFKRVRKR